MKNDGELGNMGWWIVKAKCISLESYMPSTKTYLISIILWLKKSN
jgi:hypothetical protein